MREIWVRLQSLPNDAALVMRENDGRPRWGHLEYEIADLIESMTGRPYRARPKPKHNPRTPVSSARERRVREIKRRFAQRRAAIDQSPTGQPSDERG